VLPQTRADTSSTSDVLGNTTFGQALSLLDNKRITTKTNIQEKPKGPNIHIKKEEEGQDIPTWTDWAVKFGGDVVKTGTAIAVGAAVSTTLGPIGGVLLAPAATRIVFNAGGAAKTAVIGIMDRTGVKLDRSRKKRIKASKSPDNIAQNRFAKYVLRRLLCCIFLLLLPDNRHWSNYNWSKCC
jgi:hypothetical protein